jgi:hypothetical protein
VLSDDDPRNPHLAFLSTYSVPWRRSISLVHIAAALQNHRTLSRAIIIPAYASCIIIGARGRGPIYKFVLCGKGASALIVLAGVERRASGCERAVECSSPFLPICAKFIGWDRCAAVLLSFKFCSPRANLYGNTRKRTRASGRLPTDWNKLHLAHWI